MILEYDMLVSIPKYSPPCPISQVMVLIEGGALGSLGLPDPDLYDRGAEEGYHCGFLTFYWKALSMLYRNQCINILNCNSVTSGWNRGGLSLCADSYVSWHISYMSIIFQLYRPSNIQAAISEKLNITSDETPAGLHFSVDANRR